MPLFSSKPEVELQAFCRDFYDGQVFQAVIGEEDTQQAFWDACYDSLVTADEQFRVVKPRNFYREMLAVRLELFTLAWMHKQKKYSAALGQVAFTKEYLENVGREDLWEAIRQYGNAVGSSVVMADPGKRVSEAKQVFVSKTRFDLFNKWYDEEGWDGECAALTGNHVLTEEAWKNGQALTALRLAFVDRVKCPMSERASFALQAIFYGMYNGASEAIREVRIKV